MLDPKPVPQPPDASQSDECDVCSALLRQQAAWRRLGNHSRATDCAVELQRHHDGVVHGGDAG